MDRPTSGDASTDCRDPRYTTASFLAYEGGVLVDSARVVVDDARLGVAFQLTGLPSPVEIHLDQVVIQVCRHAPPGMGLYDYCGKAVEFRAPPVL